ncbi:P-loop NTPase fold protein [Tumebacillus permanentifrigoris]|uniref:KAP-like P-loop domain-containing protein n=1 Tax=Tumebacillus permanentifrigoris TaxID=378543 RepID=A0A316DDV1_9BACL|nr:P-loop NTPase fold protein [Tumebacillus permanentifrigoris]PWK15808.1 KAP-like P-loop domain-containing protein [Tumebacillus permanentifrigoris]
MKDKSETLLISDIPSNKDEFGAHARLASALSSMILKEKGGRSIALTGSWGSGKSTVINLISKEADQLKDSDITLLTFDAWEHEGNLLRRTFLEFTIKKLLGKGWLEDQEKWNVSLSSLSNKHKEQTTKSMPRLTTGGQVMVFLTLLVPAGFILFNKLGTKLGSDVNDTFPSIYSYIGGVIALLPAGIIISIFIIKLGRKFYQSKMKFLFKTNKRERKSWKWTRNLRKLLRKASSEDFVSLLVNKFENVTITESSETPEPSSIEFQEKFESLMVDALNNDERRLVIVVDNLDRLSSDEVLKVWATMRTFLDSSSSLYNEGDRNWKEKFWLLVPFDPRAITLKLEDSSDKLNLATSLFDKTFQARFEVAPPVLSKWRHFMEQLLVQSFPNHDLVDFHKVYRIFYKIVVSIKKSPITPREIIVFVNQLGTVNRQWGNEIPIADQALFVTMKMSNQDIQLLLLNNDLDKYDVTKILGEDYYENLASLYFNVPKQEAVQLIMKPRLENAITKYNQEEISRLSEMPGFWEVSENLADELKNDFKDNQKLLVETAATYGKIPFGFITKNSVANYWETLSEIAMGIESWEMSTRIGEGLIEIMKNNRDEVLVEKILSSLSKSHRDYSVWVETIYKVFTFLEQYNYDGMFSSAFQVEMNSNEVVAMIGEGLVKKEKYRKLEKYLISSSLDAEEMQTYFLNSAQNGELTPNFSSCVQVFSRNNIQLDETKIVSAIKDRFRNDILISNEVIQSMSLVFEFINEGKTNFGNFIHDDLSIAYLMHHLKSLIDQNSFKAAMMCAIPMLMHSSEFTLSNSVWNSAAGILLLQGIANEPDKNANSINDLVRLIMSLKDKSFVYNKLYGKKIGDKLAIQIVKSAIKKKDRLDFFSAEDIVKYFRNIFYVVEDIDMEALIFELHDKTNIDELIESERFNIWYAHLYSLFVIKKSEVSKSVVDGLLKVSKDEWKEVFVNTYSLLDLAIILHQKNLRVYAGLPLEDALREYVKEVLEQGTEIARKGELHFIITLLNDSAKKRFSRDLFQIVTSSSMNNLIEVIEAFGEYLLDQDVILENTDLLVRVVFRNILDRLEDIELNWVYKIVSTIPSLKNQTEVSNWDGFAKRISMALDSEDEIANEVRGVLIEIANYILPTIDGRSEAASAASDVEVNLREEDE